MADPDHPLCKGKVKWFDRKTHSWTVKVRSSKAYLKVALDERKLMQDQTIFFIPRFSNGQMQVHRIMDQRGGIPSGTLPTWTISEPLTTRLQDKFGRLHFVSPMTRTDMSTANQLDIPKATKALPPSSKRLTDLTYLQLEELMIRQDMKSNTEWSEDSEYHSRLLSGLSPLPTRSPLPSPQVAKSRTE